MDIVSIASIRDNKCFTENKQTTRNVWEINWQYIMDYFILNSTINNNSNSKNDNNNNNNNERSIQQIGNDMFTLLWTNYNNNNRYYHTTVHIEEMINFVNLFTIEIIEQEQHNNTTNDDNNNNNNSTSSTLDEKNTNRIQILKIDKIILLLSIYFHDAIYDSTSITNEEDSILLFQQFADSIYQLNPTIRQKVSSYILATKNHCSSSTNSDTADTILLQLFLDIDISVLGKTTIAYNVYSSLIRSEYIHVPWNIYCTKRIEILQSFLQLSTIYTTTLFLDNTFEQSARANIQNEIQSLSNGLLPTYYIM